MPSAVPQLDELIADFNDLVDWEEKYDYLIDLGKQLPQLTEEQKSKENIVEGCMSTVWLVVHPSTSTAERLTIEADSDSLIVKGLVSILLSALSEKTPAEILQFDMEGLFVRLGLGQHLSVNRRNGLFAMVKRVRLLATQHLAQGLAQGS